MCLGSGSSTPAPPPPPIAAPAVLEQIAPDKTDRAKRKQKQKRKGNKRYRAGYNDGRKDSKSTLGGIPTSGTSKTPV